MCRGTKLQIYAQVLAKFSKIVVVKLLHIIPYDDIVNFVSANDVLPNKTSCLLLRELTKGFYFHLFCEKIYSHNCMCCSSSAFRQ